MCAIFGFVARGVSNPDLNTLGKIVRANIHRGQHAFGLAWIDRQGRLHSYKQQGRLTDRMGVLALARGARIIIGHLRHATHGEPSDNINNHPHPCDGGWMVHNGVVSNYEGLVEYHDLTPTSECDSEVIAQLIEYSDGDGIMDRCVRAVRYTRGNLAIMGLWKPGVLIAVRRGNPLHWSDNTDGTYLATLAGSLPGKVHEVDDNSAVKITFTGGTRNVRFQAFKPQRENQLSGHARGELFSEDEGG